MSDLEPGGPAPDPVAIVGVGSIGRPMAERLLRTGVRVLACDRDPAARDAMAAAGAATTGRAADCAGAAMAILMVADDAQLEAAALGPGGLAAGIDPAAPPLVALMSTVLPETARSVAAELAAAGARVIDAPVSGGSVRAGRGELTVMAGGGAADLEAMRPVLGRLATAIHHCGPLGAGAAAKIVNNLVGVTNLFLFSEAMALADRHGLDLPALAAAMEAGSGRNAGTRDWEERKALYRWNAGTPEAMRSLLAISRKDLGHAVALAQAAGVAAPMAEAAARALADFDGDAIRDRWLRLAR